MKQTFLKYLMPILFVFFVFFVLINRYFKSSKEYNTTYNFTITKMETTPTHSLHFYDNQNNKIVFWNFTVPDNKGVKVGDVVYKKKESKYLYIYRKDESGDLKVYLVIDSKF